MCKPETKKHETKKTLHPKRSGGLGGPAQGVALPGRGQAAGFGEEVERSAWGSDESQGATGTGDRGRASAG
jgi:hypothetical protein